MLPKPRVPRLAWGVGMSDKVIRTGPCPGGNERMKMKRLLRLIASGQVDPTPLTTHRFKSGEVGAGISAGIERGISGLDFRGGTS